MQTELISKADAVKALEEYAYAIAGACGQQAAHIAFECLRIVRKIPAYGEE